MAPAKLVVPLIAFFMSLGLTYVFNRVKQNVAFRQGGEILKQTEVAVESESLEVTGLLGNIDGAGLRDVVVGDDNNFQEEGRITQDDLEASSNTALATESLPTQRDTVARETVFQKSPRLVNVAKAARLSSTEGAADDGKGFQALNAVDGRHFGYWGDAKSVAMTSKESDPWLLINLKGNFQIQAVELWTATRKCDSVKSQFDDTGVCFSHQLDDDFVVLLA
ncbi:hypothetical protein CYMTET_34526 [Cymbomonas tetramitiformis]|uniref:Uncharacterized protein n=1 Tax=Cymbomonas tetramitiformis TaxID=36881 RepID=A0AAE0FB21_9CHLO|nr:hypothetical protein CYMTET_34526 [Cymbomonas tetramitiformis]